MRNSGSATHKRIAAGIMSIVMLAVALFSAFYLAVESDHHCTGEDCSICACIRQCEDLLRQRGNGTNTQPCVLSIAAFLLVVILLSVCSLTQETPVSVKVRLNN